MGQRPEMFPAGAERCVPEDRVGARKPSLHQRPAGGLRSPSSVLLQRDWQVLLDGVGTWLVSGSCGRAEAAKERAFISGAAAALWRSAGDDLYGGISVAGCPRLHVPNENGAIVTLANAVQ